jgi:hypothetical protein
MSAAMIRLQDQLELPAHPRSLRLPHGVHNVLLVSAGYYAGRPGLLFKITRYVWRLIVVSLLNLCLPFCLPAAAADPARILIINAGDDTMPAAVRATTAIRYRLAESSLKNAEIYYDTLDLSRFPGRAHEERMARLLSEKYAETHPDVMIALGRVAELDKNGEPVRVSGVFRDITARKRAEQEAEQLEDALRATHSELAHVSRQTTIGAMAAKISRFDPARRRTGYGHPSRNAPCACGRTPRSGCQ